MNTAELVPAIDRALVKTVNNPALSSKLRAYKAALEGEEIDAGDTAYAGPANTLATFVAAQLTVRSNPKAMQFAVGEGAAILGELLGTLRNVGVAC